MILNSNFQRLFCHWDTNIRFLFHLILLYKCILTPRTSLPSFSSDRVFSLLHQDRICEGMKCLNGGYTRVTDGGSFGGNVTRSGEEVFERVPEVEAADRRIRAVRPRC